MDPPLPHYMIKCIVYNMPVSQAIEYTGSKVSRQSLYHDDYNDDDDVAMGCNNQDDVE